MKQHLTDDTLRSLKPPVDKPQLVVFDTKLTGFGVVVGQRTTTFIINRRTGEKLVRESLGSWKGRGGDMDARTARKEALVRLGKLENKQPTPGTAKRVGRAGPTFSQACALYIERMRKDGSRPSSISTLEREIGERGRYLKEWLHRPLTSITGKECRASHEAITAKNGPHIANRVFRELRAVWNHVAKEASAGMIEGIPQGTVFPGNPTIAVLWNKENGATEYVERRREPVPWSKLPGWHSEVLELENPIRRNYNLLVLFTGLRRNDAASMRWEHVNLTDEPRETRVWNVGKQAWETVELPARTVVRPSPKGGAKRAFSIPLSSEIIKILDRRRNENAVLFEDGDNGWVFPTRAIKDGATKKHRCYICQDLGLPDHVRGGVTHIAEPKEESKKLVAPHRLRDTYTSALAEIKDPPLSPYVIDVLTNHRPPRGSVTAGYIDLSTEHLAECQERVTQLLLTKMEPPPDKRKLKAVA